jgi:tetratricopeptide (TPR) repeat protein
LYHNDVKLADAQKLADSQPQRMNRVFANLSLADLYLRDDQARAALPLINRAIRIDPKTPEAHISLSRAYLELSRLSEALKAANHAVSLDEESADAHYQHARVLSRLGRPKEAIAALKKALEIDPDVLDWVENDPPMKPLKSLPAFKKLVQEHQTPPN